MFGYFSIGSVVFAFCGLLSLGIPGKAQTQITRYVSPTGVNTNPASATSWASSTTNLQGAIHSLSATGGEVWVARGVYKPTASSAPDSRTISFSLSNNVAVYGGFMGTETSLSSRTLTFPSSTTLSGEIGDPTSTTDNSYHVLSNPIGLTATAILDGFVITGGNANGLYPHYTGGGIQNNGSGGECSPTIRNCYFLANAATYGGAIFNDGYLGKSSPQLINCLFDRNVASYGGAIYNDGYQGESSPGYINCGFLNNVANSDGGAVFNAGAEGGASNPVFRNCSFSGNSAGVSAGVMFNIASSGTGSPLLVNSVLWNNGDATTFVNTSATVVAHYSLLEPTVTNYQSGSGVVMSTLSPFISATSVQLANGTAAINSGDPNSTSVSAGKVDLVGNARFFRNGRIDMGAYELQEPLEIYSLKEGPWPDPSVWSVGRLPQAGERIRLRHAIRIPMSTTVNTGVLRYDSSGRLIVEVGGKLLLVN